MLEKGDSRATRLVVSGQDQFGKSVIVSDTMVDPVEAEIEFTSLWGMNSLPSFPLTGEKPAFDSVFPPEGGCRFALMSIPPDCQREAVGRETSHADRERWGNGAEEYLEEDAPGMHMTDTVDFEVVLSGEASQEFDDGQVVHLQAGDCFVQNGTRHRWFNRGDVPAVVAVFVIGGKARSRSR